MDNNELTPELESERPPDDDSPTLVDKSSEEDSPTVVDKTAQQPDDDSPTLVGQPEEQPLDIHTDEISSALEPPDLVEDFNYRAYAAAYDLPMPPDEGVDIDAALAAVASLSDVIAEQEAAEQKQRQAVAAREAARSAPRYTLPMPPSITLRRLHPASLFPALVLMGLGAWLTFVLTATGALPDARLLTAVAGGGLIALLVVAWLNYGLWTRGLFFLAALALLVGGGLFANDYAHLNLGLPIALAAVGIAFALTAFLSRPRDRRLLLPALVFVAAGLTAELMAEGVISTALIETLTRSWFVLPILLVVLWGLPLIFRRREG